LLLLAMILELLGRLISSTGVTVAAAAAVGAVISDALLTPGRGLAVVRRRTPARMAVGVPAPVQISVVAMPRRRYRSRRPVVVIDRPPGLEPGRVVTPRLAAGQEAVAERLALPIRRGCWPDGGTVMIEAFSPLGGFVRRTTLPIADSGWVHPAPLAPLRLPEPAAGAADGGATSRRAGAGSDFFGVREWRAGDAANAIHWRASARRNALVVLERERPGRPGLLVAVDALVDDEAGERDLARAAATAVRALRSGQAVVLVAGNSAVTPTRPGDLLDWFAALAPVAAPEPATMRDALQLLRGGATLLWVGSAAVPPEVVRQARTAGLHLVRA
jgi:uncharacterized protein (DUF58 family)